MACQQSLLRHGFDVRVSEISPGAPSPAEALTAPKLFEGADTWVPPTHLKENRILQNVCTTQASSAQLEQDTRKQAKSGRWREERRLRGTSSNFGVVATSARWTSKGLKAFTDTKDLSNIAPIKCVNWPKTSFFTAFKIPFNKEA